MFWIKTLNKLDKTLIEMFGKIGGDIGTIQGKQEILEKEFQRKTKIYEYEFDEINEKIEIIREKWQKIHKAMCNLSDEIGEMKTKGKKKCK